MKTLKKILSLVMSAILLITTNSALQATQIDGVQMEEIKELRSAIIKEVKKEKLYSNIPEPKDMISRHDLAVKNYEDNLKALDKSLEGRDAKDIKKHLNQLKKVAEYTAKHDERYLVVPEPDRQMAAFNTLLFADTDNEDLEIISFIFSGIWALSALGLLVVKSGEAIKTYKSVSGESGCLLPALAILTLVVAIAAFIIELFSGAYTPVISPSFDEEKTLQMFTEKPFIYLADFKEKNEEFEYGNIYRKGPKAAQVLNDAVDIEYYVSANPDNLENIKEKLYIGTIDWYEMTPEARAEYLHKFAERLRTETKAKTQEYSKTHGLKMGLEAK